MSMHYMSFQLDKSVDLTSAEELLKVTFVSELLDNNEGMFPLYYLDGDVMSHARERI